MASSTYKELKSNIKCIQEIQKFSLVQELNEHVQMKMTAIVKEKEKDEYVKSVSSKEPIEVYVEKNTIFKGIIKTAKIRQEGGFYFLEIEGTSYSFLMDIKKKCQSFQDKNQTYTEMIKSVLSGYENSGILDFASEGAAIKKLQLQYYETDWNYIKRMASHFNAGIIPECKMDGPKIYFGVPKGKNLGEIEDYEYKISKDIAHYMKSSKNTNQKLTEKDSITIQITSNKDFNIGDYGTFRNSKMFIQKKMVKMNKGILWYDYIFTFKNGLTKSKIFNAKFVGVSIKGKVLDRVRDNLKVHLEIDAVQDKSKAWLFPYTTMYASEGNSGWYCMPEENDTVLVYFPDAESGNAVATSSIRTQNSGGDKIDNPKIKYFRTADGKEVMFSPEEIVITCSDNAIYISLNQSDGITISSTENIKIKTDKKLTLEAEEKITIKAEEEIKMECKSSEIKMNGDIDIRGDEVKVNS